MDYKITAADAALGQIEVTYSKDGVTVAVYTIDVPIVSGHYITGDVLAQEIMRRAPVWLMERKQAVSTAANFANIQALVQAPVVVTDVADPNGPSSGAEIMTDVPPDSIALLVESRTNVTGESDTLTPAITTL